MQIVGEDNGLRGTRRNRFARGDVRRDRGIGIPIGDELRDHNLPQNHAEIRRNLSAKQNSVSSALAVRTLRAVFAVI